MRREGHARATNDIYEFWDKNAGHTKLIILDNNPLALDSHFKLISSQILKEGLTCDFQSGFDARLLNDENAQIIKKLSTSGEPTFAWDDVKTEVEVLRAIKILRKAGINRSIWYILVGYKGQTFSDALYRANLLRSLGQRIYIMPYNQERLFEDKRYHYLRNWANARMIFATITFEEYLGSLENGERSKLAACRRKNANFRTKLGTDLLEFGG